MAAVGTVGTVTLEVFSPESVFIKRLGEELGTAQTETMRIVCRLALACLPEEMPVVVQYRNILQKDKERKTTGQEP